LLSRLYRIHSSKDGDTPEVLLLAAATRAARPDTGGARLLAGLPGEQGAGLTVRKYPEVSRRADRVDSDRFIAYLQAASEVILTQDGDRPEHLMLALRNG